MSNKHSFSALLSLRRLKYTIKKIILFSMRNFFHCLDSIYYYSFYQFKSKITIVIPNKKNNSDDHKILAIFAIYQPKGLSLLVKRSIHYLSIHKIKSIIIAPHALSKIDIAFLEKNQCIVITRENFGRDFGSYKYGVLYLLDNLYLLKSFEKILLVNDSIVFPLKEQDDTLAKILTYSHDIIGLAEGYVHHWHIGSYFILFKKEFFLDKGLQNFWRNYKPYSSRVHCINKGEIILSQIILKLAHPHKKLHIIYESRKLLHVLEKPNSVIKNNSFHLKQLINDNLLATLLSSSSDTLNLKAIAHSMEHLSFIHYFSLVLIEHLDCFFIKRDICFREIFTISQILHYIASINKNEEFIEQMSLDLKYKGKISSLPFFNKLLTKAAII